MIRYGLGFDPDLHAGGWGIVQQKGKKFKLYAAGVLRVHRNLTGEDAVVAMIREIKHLELPELDYEVSVIEGQEIYKRNARSGGGNPNSLMLLAQVAGAAALKLDFPGVVLRIPKPRIWKKQVPKQIHQGRVCKDLGLSCSKRGSSPSNGYVVPELPEGKKVTDRCQNLNPGDWKHVMDGVGLALWGLRTKH